MAVNPEVLRDTGSYLMAVGLGGRPLVEAAGLMMKLPGEVNHRLGQSLSPDVTLFRHPKTGAEIWIILGERPRKP